MTTADQLRENLFGECPWVICHIGPDGKIHGPQNMSQPAMKFLFADPRPPFDPVLGPPWVSFKPIEGAVYWPEDHPKRKPLLVIWRKTTHISNGQEFHDLHPEFLTPEQFEQAIRTLNCKIFDDKSPSFFKQLWFQFSSWLRLEIHLRAKLCAESN